MRSLARQIAAVVLTALFALALATMAGGVWTGLLIANLRSTTTIPWSVPVMAALLWALWQYLGGRWWPSSTSQARKRGLRARPVAVPVFAWALVAGGFAIASLTGFWIVLIELVPVQGNPLPDFSQYPFLTVALVIVMASLVAAVAEEAGFRGYLQGMLEGKVGGPLAILIASSVMEPGHGSTQGFAWPTMLFYLLVDVTFGTTAWLTDSILPGIVTHAAGLVVFFSLVWPNDSTRGLLEGGTADPWLWIHAAQAIIFAVLAILGFVQLARAAKAAELGPAPSSKQ